MLSPCQSPAKDKYQLFNHAVQVASAVMLQQVRDGEHVCKEDPCVGNGVVASSPKKALSCT